MWEFIAFVLMAIVSFVVGFFVGFGSRMHMEEQAGTREATITHFSKSYKDGDFK